ncbi:cell-cycle regulation histidine triad HIT protein [Paenibacillus yonginensis]|uniref:Cell-cycle regulation histidine triad HIT protein n=1 Tax=Paenibacillus yonginensis TaxID=1462996 RepID=A0A1B1N5W6_9BACL|nr:HIT family protein [Paenibacillus yonginensis]ANS76802.1 cell-cycle regulation histidine triad HIT protein [Paenibacillus yonginensis]
MEDCIYCNITQESNHEILLENDLCIYSLMKDQEIQGAGIIVPRSHKETVFDLSQEEWNATYLLLHEVKFYIDNKYKPDGYNVGWNCGSVGGQHIFHSHLHVIPRYSDEPYAGKGIRYLFKSEINKRNGNS